MHVYFIHFTITLLPLAYSFIWKNCWPRSAKSSGDVSAASVILNSSFTLTSFCFLVSLLESLVDPPSRWDCIFAANSALDRQFLRSHHIGFGWQSFVHQVIVVPSTTFVERPSGFL